MRLLKTSATAIGSCWQQFIIKALVLTSLLVVLTCTFGVSASTTSLHVPRQKFDSSEVPESYHDLDLIQATRTLPPKNPPIHVLPPSPNDNPLECDANSTLYSTCGIERYCSKLHSSSNTSADGSYYCLHKTLWDPRLDIRDFIAFILTGTCCFLAAMAGIGGGGLILPILLICCNFTPKEASVLSNTAVFFNTLGQFIVNNYGKSSTSLKKSALVYATVLMIMPGLIAGGSVAITLEGMVPSTVILILALLTLLLASTKTYHKAKKMRQQELERDQEEVAALATDSMETPSVSPIEPANVRSGSRGKRNIHDHSHGQEDALLASALEWGPMLNGGEGGVPTTPANKSKNGSELLSSNDSISDPFFGSIGRFMRENPESYSALIIDELSLPSSSFDENGDINGSEENANGHSHLNRSAVSHHIQHHAGCCGMICTFCSNHKLQILIGVFWMLDATTFLLLHTGTLVSRCSVSFFVLMVLPAVFAVVSVGLGRCHLLSLRARSNNRRRRGFDDVERRPLLTTFFSNSSDDDDDNDDGDDDPIPPPIESGRVTTSPTYRRQNSPWMQDQRWVMLVPLVSTVAGILRALKVRSRRRYQRNQSSGLNAGPPDMAEPLLSPDNNQEFTSIDEESSVQDDYKSLLAWWLPWASVLIGLLAALLGIGGGELLGPILLLLLQMNPQESSATTAIMSMMNSGTNLLHYIVAGMIVAPGYAINLGFMGLLGGSMGRLWATSIAQQGRTSIIAMSLCLVLSLATALVAWELVTTPMSWKSSAGVC